MTTPVGPGQLYLIDTSAHARIDHLPVRTVITGLITDRARDVQSEWPPETITAPRESSTC